ncbi:hypothetical protein DY000_02048806 [Brassica cretica]|uniref:Uncharacterized protein n=1 Tax=Brassica cretica TaxID=69181 RepID=A0ABQ7F3J4_BRACR|nr:hypothetical protein DY000_02048806 [Brassica cretica]
MSLIVSDLLCGLLQVPQIFFGNDQSFELGLGFLWVDLCSLTPNIGLDKVAVNLLWFSLEATDVAVLRLVPRVVVMSSVG